MTDLLDDIKLRSEEVQAILTKVPSWMLRWGNVLMLLLILLFFSISWFIKYPEVIGSTVIITTENPPQKEFAERSGKIEQIFTDNFQKVKSNEIVAVIENSANFQDVFLIKSVVDTISLYDSNSFSSLDDIQTLNLGEIDPHYHLFKRDYYEYVINEKLKIKKQNNTSKLQKSVLFEKVLQSLSKLKIAIVNWEKEYVKKSKIDGVISNLNHSNINNIFSKGDLLFTILPSEYSRYIGKLKTPIKNSGKIKMGQEVNIKLENYPYPEYGILKGRIESISLLPNNDGFYLIDISLSNKLVTTYNKELDFKQDMNGLAEIITEDLRLTERFLYQFRGIYSQEE